MMRDCDSCRSAPAAVYCQADAAFLCSGCDAEVHSANLISHRHQRVPVIGAAEQADDEYTYNDVGSSSSYEALFSEEVDEYLELGEFNKTEEMELELKPAGLGFDCSVKSEMSEVGVVPVQSVVVSDGQEFGYSTAALSHGVSLSSMETNSAVPDTAGTEVSHPHVRPFKGTIELFSGYPIQVPTHFSPMDREARVLRYREKKKMRKFEKTIRYASRKAYAEARPRIKGRFAKRSEVELQMDQMLFSDYIVSEDSYGIVPSFQS